MIARLACVALALSAVAADDPLAGRTAGPSTICIDLASNQQVRIVDARTILYSETNRRLWRTGTDGPCPDLEPEATIIADVQGGQLCQGDRFRVRRMADSVPSAGFCRFTKFVPYDKR